MNKDETNIMVETEIESELIQCPKLDFQPLIDLDVCKDCPQNAGTEHKIVCHKCPYQIKAKGIYGIGDTSLVELDVCKKCPLHELVRVRGQSSKFPYEFLEVLCNLPVKRSVIYKYKIHDKKKVL